MTAFGFDVGSTKPSVAFDPLPPGWYAMRVVRAEEAVSEKPGTGGKYIKVEFEIMEHAHPEFAGRKVFANFFHLHDNKPTRDIARANIAAICQAVGKRDAKTTEEILGGELRVKLKVSPPSQDGKYDARNEAKDFRALSDVVEAPRPAAGGATQTAAPASASAPAAANKQPWKR